MRGTYFLSGLVAGLLIAVLFFTATILRLYRSDPQFWTETVAQAKANLTRRRSGRPRPPA